MLFLFFPLYFMYLNPSSCAICGGNARLEEEPGCAQFISPSSPVQRALLAPSTFTQAQIHWEGVKDLCPLWDIPGSQLHFSSSLKDPAICRCFQEPPACQRDGWGCQLREDLACARGWPAVGQVVEVSRGDVDARGTALHKPSPIPSPPRWLCPRGSSPTQLRVSISRSPPHELALLHFSCQA